MSMEKKNEKKLKALVSGATGSIGRELTKYLLENENYSSVVALVRQQSWKDPKDGFWGETGLEKLEQQTIDYDELPTFQDGNYDHAFCCLGTTRYLSGKEGFIKVDYDYITSFSQQVRDADIPTFCLCSSKGANSNSVLLYMKTKGRADEFVQARNFPTCIIVRPGVIFGKEQHDMKIKKVVEVCTPRFMGAKKEAIAKCMVEKALVLSKMEQPQNFIVENDEVNKFDETTNTSSCIIS